MNDMNDLGSYKKSLLESLNCSSFWYILIRAQLVSQLIRVQLVLLD